MTDLERIFSGFFKVGPLLSIIEQPVTNVFSADVLARGQG